MHTESTLFLCVIFFVLLLKWSQHFVFQLRNASKSKQSKFRCTINRLIPLHNCSKQWRSWPFAATADEHGKTNERTSTTTATWTASRLIRQKGIHKSSKHCYVYIATTLRIINKTNETGGAEARLTNINHSSCVFVCCPHHHPTLWYKQQAYTYTNCGSTSCFVCISMTCTVHCLTYTRALC